MNPLIAVVNTVVFHGGCVLGAVFRADYVRKAKRGRETSEKMLRKLMRENSSTDYGKKHHFSEIHSIAEFQEKVPLSDYEDYREYVRRTAENGEQGLMTSRRIHYFALTSGTTKAPKLIPQVPEAFLPNFKCICILLAELIPVLRQRGISSLTARGLVYIDALPDKPQETDKHGIRRGIASSYSIDCIKFALPLFTPFPSALLTSGEVKDIRYLKALFALRDPDLKFASAVFSSALLDLVRFMLENHESLVHDLETGTIRADVEMSARVRAKLEKALRPDPRRAAELREIFATPDSGPVISRIWPKLSLIACGGGGDFTPFTEALHSYTTPDVRHLHNLYCASEGTMGIALHLDEPSYMLIPNTGFYEFLPVVDGVTQTDRVLLPHELERGKLYEIVVTNLAGLYRYRLLDVLSVSGFVGDTPCLRFAYRANHLTDICGIHLTDQQLAESVTQAAKSVGARALDYCIYADDTSSEPCLDLYLEPDRALSEDERRSLLDTFDKALGECDWIYKYYRRDKKQLFPPRLHIVRPGAFRRYRDLRISAGASANQIKAMRLIDTPEKLAFFEAEEEKEN